MAKGIAVSTTSSSLLGDVAAGAKFLLTSSLVKGRSDKLVFSLEVSTSAEVGDLVLTEATVDLAVSSSTSKLPFEESRIDLFGTITGEVGRGDVNAATGGDFGSSSTKRDSFVLPMDFSFFVTMGEFFACCCFGVDGDVFLRGGVTSASFVDFEEVVAFFLRSSTLLFGKFGEGEDCLVLFLERFCCFRFGGTIVAD